MEERRAFRREAPRPKAESPRLGENPPPPSVSGCNIAWRKNKVEAQQHRGSAPAAPPLSKLIDRTGTGPPGTPLSYFLLHALHRASRSGFEPRPVLPPPEMEPLSPCYLTRGERSLGLLTDNVNRKCRKQVLNPRIYFFPFHSRPMKDPMNGANGALQVLRSFGPTWCPWSPHAPHLSLGATPAF